jgi:hypothetical protein
MMGGRAMARRSLVFGAAISLLMVVGVGSSSSEAVPRACGGWSVVPSPDEGDQGRLFAVDAVSANDAWAVGESLERGLQRGLTEHWDGSAWSIVPSFYSGRGEELLGVAAVASGDVWAVGDTSHQGYFVPFAEHWDGTTWTRVAVPRRLGVHNYLTAVSAVSSDDAWAVGYTWAPHTSYQRTLIEHWDGSSWSIVPSPNPYQKALYNQLLGVNALSADDVWAVGYYEARGPNLPLIEHWDGTSWSIVDAPAADEINALYAVAAAGPSDVWAVGEAYELNPGHTLIEHWDGSAWSIVPSPSLGVESVLHGVTVISSGDVWALGGTSPSQIYPQDTLAEHWDGSTWTVVPTDPMPPSNEWFNGAVAISSSDVWGVGIFEPLNDLTLTEHYCP